MTRLAPIKRWRRAVRRRCEGMYRVIVTGGITTALKLAGDRCPASVLIRSVRGYQRLGALREAELALAKAFERVGVTPELLLAAGNLAYASGDWLVARARYELVRSAAHEQSRHRKRAERSLESLKHPHRHRDDFQIVCRITGHDTYGFDVIGEGLDASTKRQVLLETINEYRSNVRELLGLKHGDYAASAITWAPDSTNFHLHACYVANCIRRICAITDSHKPRACWIDVRLPRDIDCLVRKVLAEVDVTPIHHPVVSRSQRLAKSTVARHTPNQEQSQSSSFGKNSSVSWVALHFLLQAARRLRTIAAFEFHPTKVHGSSTIHVHVDFKSRHGSPNPAQYLQWRMKSIVEQWPRGIDVYAFASRDRATNRKSHRGTVRARSVSKRPFDLPEVVGFGLLDELAGLGALLWGAGRGCFISGQIRNDARRKARQSVVPEIAFLATSLARHLNWKMVYQKIAEESGAAQLVKRHRPVAAMQALGISKDVFGWTRAFRRQNVPVIYVSDRVLSPERPSNHPLVTPNLDPKWEHLPSHYVVFDRISWQTLCDFGVPADRMFFIPRVAATKGGQSSGTRSTCISVYLQDYKDGMLETIAAAAFAAEAAGLEHLHLRAHPNFRLSDASISAFSQVGWGRLAIRFGAPSDSCASAASVSAYSTALVADAMMGSNVIWINFTTVNSVFGNAISSEFGATAHSTSELIRMVSESTNDALDRECGATFGQSDLFSPPVGVQESSFNDVLDQIRHHNLSS